MLWEAPSLKTGGPVNCPRFFYFIFLATLARVLLAYGLQDSSQLVNLQDSCIENNYYLASISVRFLLWSLEESKNFEEDSTLLIPAIKLASIIIIEKTSFIACGQKDAINNQ